MAKGNALLGYARGSVGDVTFSRVKGQQVSKARNRKPANPKTKRQMLQRASFINPVKFFTQGVQAFYKFAYSDKKVTESDFNAFQRHNAKASYPVTKDEYNSNKVAPIGRYMMTKGKLPGVVLSSDNTHEGCPVLRLVGISIDSTMAVLSQFLIDSFGLSAGDIVTIVAVEQLGVTFSAAGIDFTNAESVTWSIEQFILDTADTRLINTVFTKIAVYDYLNDSFIGPRNYSDAGDGAVCGLAIAVSRETALGLETSTAFIKWDTKTDAYIDLRNTDAEVAKVLTSWGATGEAILQGSIAKA